jgi:hypothetical protein
MDAWPDPKPRPESRELLASWVTEAEGGDDDDGPPSVASAGTDRLHAAERRTRATADATVRGIPR